MRFASLVAILVLALPAGLRAQKDKRKAVPPGVGFQPPGAPTTPELAGDEQVLKSAHLGNAGPPLIAFFKARTERSADPDTIKNLIGQLGDKMADRRDKAFGGLVQAGMVAVPLLREAANNVDDAATATQARACLQCIEGDGAAALSAAAARLLAQHNPTGTAAALLGFLPFAENDKVAQEVEAALLTVAAPRGKLNPRLLTALKDDVPVRRAAAADIVCQAGTPAERLAVKALLKDAKATVRLRAALGLAKRHEVEAIPVLIDLLGELPAEQRGRCEGYLTELAGEWAVKVPTDNTPFAQRLRREVWLAWWKATEGPLLLDEFRKRTLTDADRARVLGLLKDLAKEPAREREQAAAALVEVGPKALPLLRKAMQDGTVPSTDVVLRCAELLRRDGPGPLPSTAARLLALRKPEGAAAVLLAFLPFAETDDMVEALQESLPDLALRDGTADPAFLKALADPLPARRIAAAEALAACAGQQEAVRKLFKDKDAEVRLRAALALAGGGDRESIPELIALLADAPADRAWMAEDYLSRLAGAKRPEAALGGDDAARKKARDAWATWWKDNGARVRLVRRDSVQRLLGYTLVLEQYNNFTGSGRVLEFDANNKVRWEIGGLAMPLDVQVIGDRVLIVEQNFNRITERDFKGVIKWTKQVFSPLAAQRLKNGNTFIARRNELSEIDRAGKEVLKLPRGSDYLLAAGRLRDGTYAFVNNQNIYVRLDRTGKELKRFNVPFDPVGGQLQFTIVPNGNILVGQYSARKVIEVDREGKRVWEATVDWPSLATRLANGHTLVACSNHQKVVELDRAGKVVREIVHTNMRPFKAERR